MRCHRTYCYPSLTPLKDMETVVQGTCLRSPTFNLAMHTALRTLIDKLGAKTYNVGVSGMQTLSGTSRRAADAINIFQVHITEESKIFALPMR